MARKEKYIQRAQKYIQKGSLDKAITEYKSAFDADPRDVSIRLRLGDLYVKTDRRDEAINEYTEAAKANTQRGFYLKAIAVYKQVLKLDESILDVHYKLADLYTRQRLNADAIAEYSYIVSTFQKAGKSDEARELIQKMLEIDPENTGVRLRLAESYQKAGFGKDALAQYLEASDLLIKNKRLDRAEKVLTALRGDYPDDTGPLERLIELHRAKENAEGFAASAVELAERYASEGREEEAGALVAEALEKAPGDARAAALAEKLGPPEGAPAEEETPGEEVPEEEAPLAEDAPPAEEAPAEAAPPVEEVPVEAEEPAPQTGFAEGSGPEAAEEEGDIEIELEGFDEEEEPGEAPVEAAVEAEPAEEEAGPATEAGEAVVEIDVPGLEVELPEPSIEPIEPVEAAPAEEPSLEDEAEPAEAGHEEPPVAEEAGAAPVEDFAPEVEDEPSGEPRPVEEILPDSVAPEGVEDDLAGAGTEAEEEFAPGEAREAEDFAVEDAGPPEETAAPVEEGPEGVDETSVAEEAATPGPEETARAEDVEAGGEAGEYEVPSELENAFEDAMKAVEEAGRAGEEAPDVFEEEPGDFAEEIEVEITGPEEEEGAAGPVEEPPSVEEPPAVEAAPPAAEAVEEEPTPVEAAEEVPVEETFPEEAEPPQASGEAAEAGPLAEEPAPVEEASEPVGEAREDSAEEPPPVEGIEEEPAFETGPEAVESPEEPAFETGPEAVEAPEEPAFEPEPEAAESPEEPAFETGPEAEEAPVEEPAPVEAEVPVEETLPEAAEEEPFDIEGAEAPPVEELPTEAPGMEEEPFTEDSEEELSEAIDELMEKIEPEEHLLESHPGPVTDEEAAGEEGGGEGFVDLTTELGMEEALETLSGSWNTVESVESVDEFKNGIGKQLSREDTETHYNLGIAYMEMELYEEASNEFRIALKDPRLEFDCYSRLGLCAMRQGGADDAVAYYLRGLKAEGRTDGERKGMMYELALAYEAAGEDEEALDLMRTIYEADPDYREVAEKLRGLEGVRPMIPLDDGMIEVELL